VLSFPPGVAPIKCLVVPISANKEFTNHVQILSQSVKVFVITFTHHSLGGSLRKKGISVRVDDSGTSIGRRYARNDELGTPFAVTIDFQTLQDQTVTLRERDSTRQIRANVGAYSVLCKRF
jgi:glycyl-tRNA synthetase